MHQQRQQDVHRPLDQQVLRRGLAAPCPADGHRERTDVLRSGDDDVACVRHEVTRLVFLHAVLHDAVAQRGAHAADKYRIVVLHDPHQFLDAFKAPAARRFLLVRKIVNVFLIPLHGAFYAPAIGKKADLLQLAQITFVPVDHHGTLGLVQGEVQPVG